MLRTTLAVSAGLMILLTINVSHAEVTAQVTIDVAKTTCEQIYKSKLQTARSIGLWLSGFQHGKQNDTVINLETLRVNAKELIAYCVRNPRTLIFEAAEKLFGEKKN